MYTETQPFYCLASSLWDVCPHSLGYIWRQGAIHMPCSALLPSGGLRVTDALKKSGLESSNLILGIDFTKSDQWIVILQLSSILQSPFHHGFAHPFASIRRAFSGSSASPKWPSPIFRTLGAMADKHGPVFMIQLGMHPAVVVSSHEAVKECFTTNDKMRKLSVVEILSARRLNELKDVRISELDACIKDLYSLGKDNNWISPIKVVMSEWFEHLTFNFALRMIAGKRYFDNAVHGNEEARGAIITIKKYLSLSGAFVPSDVFPFLERLDLQGYLGSMKHVTEELDRLVGSWVEEHVMRLKSEPGCRHDFIDVLLSTVQDTSMFGHTRETVIKATIVNLIVGGSDSTSITSTWILSALLNNREAMKHAQEELDLKVGRSRWVEESDIQKLDYLRAIIKESLRLYPAAPLLVPHEATQDCHVCGYHIPKGFDMATPSNAPVDMTEGISFTMPKLTPLRVMLTPRLPSHLY
ncbi:Cytochrome P450 82C4 [Vitis vinifera]|uniref:Cytochrome P450 82C4 n=1 Tax=Vitis vinifera TaxID=29760 RepID=A0A438BTU3_VITVI|nr:Cytochrome P450 82C4 [Vitis vinifera]